MLFVGVEITITLDVEVGVAVLVGNICDVLDGVISVLVGVLVRLAVIIGVAESLNIGVKVRVYETIGDSTSGVSVCA